jgi:hypothetical protein
MVLVIRHSSSEHTNMVIAPRNYEMHGLKHGALFVAWGAFFFSFSSFSVQLGQNRLHTFVEVHWSLEFFCLHSYVAHM